MLKLKVFLGKFYRYFGRYMKTIRNKWKKELETFSDKTGNFQITFFSE